MKVFSRSENRCIPLCCDLFDWLIFYETIRWRSPIALIIGMARQRVDSFFCSSRLLGRKRGTSQMHENKYLHLPVVDEGTGEVLGVVGVMEIIRATAGAKGSDRYVVCRVVRYPVQKIGWGCIGYVRLGVTSVLVPTCEACLM